MLESQGRQGTPAQEDRTLQEVSRFASFALDPAGGNPAGVVLTDEHLQFCQMQSLAADTGCSVTAFVTPRGDQRYRVRYFTPSTEVPFAGHATIASGVALARRVSSTVHPVFLTSGGAVPVDIHRDAGSLAASWVVPYTQTRPVLAPAVEEALACFGWSSSVLAVDLPAAEAVDGDLHLILPLGAREDLSRMRYDFDRLRELMWNQSWSTVLLVWRENAASYHARIVSPGRGSVEEPPSGAGVAALGGLLRNHNVVSPAGEFIVHQGAEVGHPGMIFVEAPAGLSSVRVRGWAVPLPRPAPGAPAVSQALRGSSRAAVDPPLGV